VGSGTLSFRSEQYPFSVRVSTSKGLRLTLAPGEINIMLSNQ
jgi:hypothetical protein